MEGNHLHVSRSGTRLMGPWTMDLGQIMVLRPSSFLDETCGRLTWAYSDWDVVWWAKLHRLPYL